MIIIIKVPDHFKGKLLFGGFIAGTRVEINFWVGAESREEIIGADRAIKCRQGYTKLVCGMALVSLSVVSEPPDVLFMLIISLMILQRQFCFTASLSLSVLFGVCIGRVHLMLIEFCSIASASRLRAKTQFHTNRICDSSALVLLN